MKNVFKKSLKERFKGRCSVTGTLKLELMPEKRVNDARLVYKTLNIKILIN